MGPLYNVYVGLATGHYFLDMKDDKHIRGGKKLAGMSNNEIKVARTLGVNTSQKGVLSSFRNEFHNKEPFSLTAQWFTTHTPSGVVRCDFVSTSRPRQVRNPLVHSLRFLFDNL